MSTCPLCAYVAAHGWWGPGARGGAHCKGCHRSWTAKAECHCTTCHRHFANYSAADLHLRTHGGGEQVEHLDPAKLRDRNGRAKLALDEQGVWHSGGERPAYWRGVA
jgi:hypothetical protein